MCWKKENFNTEVDAYVLRYCLFINPERVVAEENELNLNSDTT